MASSPALHNPGNSAVRQPGYLCSAKAGQDSSQTVESQNHLLIEANGIIDIIQNVYLYIYISRNFHQISIVDFFFP